MRRKQFFDLAVLTLRAPQQAAAQIISLNLNRNALWSGLALTAIINTVMFNITLMAAGDTSTIPDIFKSPIAFFIILAGILVMTVHAFYWTGLSIGGKGDLGHLLALLVWLQLLRAVAQAAMVVLLAVSPGFALLFSFATGIVGLWILVNFITAALHLPSVAHGFAVVILAAVGLILGLLLIGGLVGLSSLGVPANV